MSAEEYVILLNSTRKPDSKITIDFTGNSVKISDNCGGISAEDAENSVFVFGAEDPESHRDDRLSVYGIGMKRAIFKLGNRIKIDSEHPQHGFSMDLDVKKWESKKEDPWFFEIATKPKSQKGTTRISISEINNAVQARLKDPSFETQLCDRISQAYAFFVSRVVKIVVNGQTVNPAEIKLSSNRASDNFESEGVTVSIVAGIGTPDDKRYSSEKAGWNVFCNGRAVILFDRSPLTGWGISGFLPSFQPKHRPFLGHVFFTSDIPENLPWTTTKQGVNSDNQIWQLALRRMADVGRQVTSFLDNRYSEEGTTITLDEMQDAIGKGDEVAITMTSSASTFAPPKKTSPPTTSVQYHVDKKIISRVKKAIGKSSMSNSDTGRYTFDYFVENELDDG